MEQTCIREIIVRPYMPWSVGTRLAIQAKWNNMTQGEYILRRCEDITYSDFQKGKRALDDIKALPTQFRGDMARTFITFRGDEVEQAQELADTLTKGDLTTFVGAVMLLI